MKLNELQRIQQLAGLKEFIDPEGQYTTTAAPNDEEQSKKGYAVRVIGTFVPPNSNFAAGDLWEALETILPNDYPTADFQQQNKQITPQLRVLQTIARQGSAIVKTGIANRDIAETIANKFENYKGRHRAKDNPYGKIRAEVIELDSK